MLKNYLPSFTVYGLFVLACALVLTACGSSGLKIETLSPQTSPAPQEDEEEEQVDDLTLKWFFGLNHEANDGDLYLELEMKDNDYIEPRKNSTFSGEAFVRVEFSAAVLEESIDLLIEYDSGTSTSTISAPHYLAELDASGTELTIHFDNTHLSNGYSYRVSLLDLETVDNAPKSYSRSFSILRGDYDGNAVVNLADKNAVLNVHGGASIGLNSNSADELVRADIYNLNGHGGVVDSQDSTIVGNFNGSSIQGTPFPPVPMD